MGAYILPDTASAVRYQDILRSESAVCMVHFRVYILPISRVNVHKTHLRCQKNTLYFHMPNILGKVGWAAMGFGAALAICCHHQRNASQVIRSRTRFLCHFRHLLAVLYITKYSYTRHTQCSKHSNI